MKETYYPPIERWSPSEQVEKLIESLNDKNHDEQLKIVDEIGAIVLKKSVKIPKKRKQKWYKIINYILCKNTPDTCDNN